ncbi:MULTISPECIES: hypothetical protein [Arthrobacter]|uniref:hypothetical protein n=1 Tax=unclassified Arthrobacter TaxID=235627 RepID=UPI0024BB12C6|nr:hypothetical protein [Arthrobacter sp. H35-MC1]MDJ0316902.1 hypothetical protein [Arthrobacter sp. H35-MC1]
MVEQEVPLEGGNATDGVVWIGSTSRKQWTANTPAPTWSVELACGTWLLGGQRWPSLIASSRYGSAVRDVSIRQV